MKLCEPCVLSTVQGLGPAELFSHVRHHIFLELRLVRGEREGSNSIRWFDKRWRNSSLVFVISARVPFRVQVVVARGEIDKLLEIIDGRLLRPAGC